MNRERFHIPQTKRITQDCAAKVTVAITHLISLSLSVYLDRERESQKYWDTLYRWMNPVHIALK